MLLHLDTDLGTNPDDACALAMLLGWGSDVSLAGITTTADPGGVRAGCAEHVLSLAGRLDVPVVAGAAGSLSQRDTRAAPAGWPGDLRPCPAPPGAAVDALVRSVSRGAVLVALGPLTNLAVLELVRPGTLADASVVLMGGWVEPPGAGLPAWPAARDSNVQADVLAAQVVLEAAGRLTVVPLAATLQAPMRAADLAPLAATGQLGGLLARQSRAHGAAREHAALAAAHPGLPDDLVLFHHDPLTCVVALGWPGVTVRSGRLAPVVEDGVLRLAEAPDGREVDVADTVDGPAFAGRWLQAVEAAQRS